MRLIDADAAIEFLTGFGNREYRSEKGTIREAIKALRHEEYTPTVDAEPVRHGHWIVFKDENGIFRNKCSACGSPMRKGYKQTNFCPNCGAKMDKCSKEETT